jgi:hypothetical protein
MKKMYQVVLKNNKNGAKLFNSPIEAIKYHKNDIKSINDIVVNDFTNIKTGNRNKRGRQFAMRAGV